MGKRLTPLREEGVLIIGSGNIVHNLAAYAWGKHNIHPFDWAVRFEEHVREMLSKGDDAPLVDYQSFGHDATLSVPTPDHYLPFLYVLGHSQGTGTGQLSGTRGGWWLGLHACCRDRLTHCLIRQL
jgi:4,5-DOPA dioxygenase extradiol